MSAASEAQIGRAGDPPSRRAFVASGAVIFACFAFMLALSWLRWPDILIDFGEELYVPWRLLEGDVLYRDLFFARGPFSPYLNAAVFAVFGVDFLALALFNVFVIASVCALLYALYLRGDRILSATLTVAVFLLVFAFGQYTGVGNYNFVTPYSHEQTHGPALALLGFFALRAYLRGGGAAWLALVGGAGGCVFLTKPEIFLGYAAAVGVAACVLWLKAEGRGAPGREGALAFALGFTAPIALFVLVVPISHPGQPASWPVLSGWSTLLAIGEAATADPLTGRVLGFDRPLLNLGRMGAQLAGYLAVFAGLLAVNHFVRVARNQRLLGVALGGLLAAGLLHFFDFPGAWQGLLRPLPALLALYLGVQLVVLLRADRSEARLADRVPILALSVFALAMIARMLLHARVEHYGFSLALPATAVIAEALVCGGARVARRISGRSEAYTGLSLALLGVFVAAHVEQTRGYLDLKTALVGDTFESYGPESDPRAPIVNDAIDWIEAHTTADETVVVLPEGVMLNFLTRRASPVRFFTFNPVLLEIYAEQEIVQALRWSPPDYVVFVERDNSEHGARYFGVDYAKDLFRWIDRHYVLATQLGATPFTRVGFGIRILRARPDAARAGEGAEAMDDWEFLGAD